MKVFPKTAEEIPGTYGLTYVGEAIEIFTTIQLYYWKRWRRYGSVFKTKVMGMKLAILVGPDANQFVLKDQAENFSSKEGWSYLEPILGEGILLQDGAEHQAIRRLMNPAFHGQAIASYFRIVQDTVESFLNSWVGSHIILFDEFRRLTLNIACRLFLGIENEGKSLEVKQWFSEFIEGQLTILRLDVPLTKFGRARRARHNLETFIHSAISQRPKKGNLNEFKDVLGLLLASTDEEENCLSDSEIVNQTLILLFGGHETIAKLLCWLLFELAAHPQWIERLREEQNQVVGNNLLAPSHLRKLPEMSYVLKEVERLYPPVFAIPRGVTQDVEFAGYHIPAGWHINICPMLTHRISELYADPDKFDPCRFAPPREEDKKHPFALIGFGGGAHKCLGYELAQMEMKIFLSALLHKFDWSVTPKYSDILPVRQPTKIERILKAEVRPVAKTRANYSPYQTGI